MANKASHNSLDFSIKLRDQALAILDERQAENIITFDMTRKTALADYIIVASGRSGRQLGAICDYISQKFKQTGVKTIFVEGLEKSDWVILDAGDVIIHLFRPEVRDYYAIEEIWEKRATGVPSQEES